MSTERDGIERDGTERDITGRAVVAAAGLDTLAELARELRELSVALDAFIAGDDAAFTAEEALAGYHTLALASMQAGTIRRMREQAARRATVVPLTPRPV